MVNGVPDCMMGVLRNQTGDFSIMFNFLDEGACEESEESLFLFEYGRHGNGD